MKQSKASVVVVGGGLAGLAAAYKLADEGCFVTLLSVTHCKRSHSVCAQGGINAAINLKGENDSPVIHAYDTIKGGDFLANQPPVLEMCLAAPRIIHLLDRLGCPFNRTSEGELDFRRFGGTLYNRTAFCGASTGQQLLYSLDEQVRRYESMGRVVKKEFFEFTRLVTNEEGRAIGVVALDLFNMGHVTIPADAVVIATGGLGLIFKKSTNSTFCSGAANGRLFMQGMRYANGEFIQIHPTAIPGEDKLRLMSESARGEGGRIWVWGNSDKKICNVEGVLVPCGKTGEPWYFLEELYPAYGNLVPRDIAARVILEVCNLGLGIEGRNEVFLDVSHLSSDKQKKLQAILEIYQKFTGDDPHKVPMRIFPAVHYSMGGAWVDWPAADDPDRLSRFRQMTNIPGCFNIGESDYAYHGANRLGANSLLSCIFAGLVVGKEIPRYLASCSFLKDAEREKYLKEGLNIEKAYLEDLKNRRGKENIFALHEELAKHMVEHVTVRRSDNELDLTYQKILEIRERFKNINLFDTAKVANQTLIFANQFEAMLNLALVITKGARLRNEFRGSHFKPPYLERDDENWLKTTIAVYNKETREPEFFYEPIDTRHFPVGKREYTKAEKYVPEIQNMPKNIELPL